MPSKKPARKKTKTAPARPAQTYARPSGPIAAPFPAVAVAPGGPIAAAVAATPGGIVPQPGYAAAIAVATGFRREIKARDLKTCSVAVPKEIDPRLQLAVARARTGVARMASASTTPAEIAVIAKVSQLDAWNALSEVRSGAVLGTDSDGATIVTARIPVTRIEAVRQNPVVASLKAAQRIRPALDATTREIGCRPSLLPAGTQPQGGRGVIVGIVDFGCDFAHQNFRLPNGSSRILAIWDQMGDTIPNSPVGYGRIYGKSDIDQALKQSNPYQALGYGPSARAHGTHVMDIAAGNGRGSGVPGCAPEADIIFVELGASDIPWDGPQVIGSSFGDSVQLLEAVRFIFDMAGDRPCIVNLSLGTNGGPHDGSTLVEQGLDLIVQSAPNRAIVLAASNSFNDGIHAQGTVAQGATSDLLWDLSTTGFGHEMEIWYPGAQRLAVELIAPDGAAFGPVDPGANLPLGDAANQIVLFIANRLNDSNNHDNCINIFLGPEVPPGRWTVRLRSRSNNATDFHAWIERLDQAQSSFAPPNNNQSTLGSISCGRSTIVVGSYDAHKQNLPISFFSSAGPTRDGRQKPELSAPGHDVFAAASGTGMQVVRMSGTSMAAPAVTGLTALLFAEAARKNASLSVDQTRDLLIQAARQNPPPIAAGDWDPRFGFGRVSSNALAAVP